MQPEIVIPGEWMMDNAQKFLFLPLTVPADMSASQVKVMSNGESLLVVVTEQPKEEPETNALRKYKLVIEAIKKETGHDEALLQTKLQTWFETEDDDEVKPHIRAALDSLIRVRSAKKQESTKSVSVSLGMPQKKSASSLMQLSAVPAASVPSTPVHSLSASLRGQKQAQHRHRVAKVIKESFAVEIPYPVPTERIVLINTKATTMTVAMPLVRKSLEASGISTGGKPFNRIPVFNSVGSWMAGPKIELAKAAEGLNVAAVVDQAGFEPLTDE